MKQYCILQRSFLFNPLRAIYLLDVTLYFDMHVNIPGDFYTPLLNERSSNSLMFEAMSAQHYNFTTAKPKIILVKIGTFFLIRGRFFLFLWELHFCS